MPTFIGLLNFKDLKKTKAEELRCGKLIRAETVKHGGRILSIYWTDDDPDMITSFEGTDIHQANNIFQSNTLQQFANVRILRGLTEGEKERQL